MSLLVLLDSDGAVSVDVAVSESITASEFKPFGLGVGDTVQVSDSRFPKAIRTLTDQLSLSESRTPGPAVRRGDDIAVSEGPLRRAVVKLARDLLTTLLDIPFRGIGVPPRIDQVTASESRVPGPAVRRGDDLAASDVTKRGVIKRATDTITASEQLYNALTYVRLLFENVSVLADVRKLGATEIPRENLTALDVPLRKADKRVAPETVFISEFVSRAFFQFRILIDNILATSDSRSLGVGELPRENLTASEATPRSAGVRRIEQTSSITESVQRAFFAARLVTDLVSVLVDVTRRGPGVLPSDTATASEAIPRSAAKRAIDSPTITEARGFGKGLSDSIGASDFTRRGPLIRVYDQAAVTEAIVKGYGKPVFDLLTASERRISLAGIKLPDTVTILLDVPRRGVVKRAIDSVVRISDLLVIPVPPNSAYQIDEISVTDLVYLLIKTNLFENIRVTDQAIRGRYVRVTDQAVVDEYLRKGFGLISPDQIGVTDPTKRSIVSKISDTIQAIETALKSANRKVIDQAAIDEYRMKGFDLLSKDQIGITDPTKRNVSRVTYDSMQVMDAAIKSPNKRVIDQAIVSDFIVRVKNVLKLLTDTTSILDPSLQFLTLPVISIDTVGVSDPKVSRAVTKLIADTIYELEFFSKFDSSQKIIATLKFTEEILRVSGFTNDSLRVSRMLNDILRRTKFDS